MALVLSLTCCQSSDDTFLHRPACAALHVCWSVYRRWPRYCWDTSLHCLSAQHTYTMQCYTCTCKTTWCVILWQLIFKKVAACRLQANVSLTVLWTYPKDLLITHKKINKCRRPVSFKALLVSVGYLEMWFGFAKFFKKQTCYQILFSYSKLNLTKEIFQQELHYEIQPAKPKPTSHIFSLICL